MWNKVKAEYEKKSKMVTVDMRRKLQDEKCPEGGDVKAHLMKLQTIREGLIAMGADPGDENFVAIVLGSLPTSYETYLSALTGTATLLGKTLDPDIVLKVSTMRPNERLCRPKREAREKLYFTVEIVAKDQRNAQIGWNATTATRKVTWQKTAGQREVAKKVRTHEGKAKERPT